MTAAMKGKPMPGEVCRRDVHSEDGKTLLGYAVSEVDHEHQPHSRFEAHEDRFGTWQKLTYASYVTVADLKADVRRACGLGLEGAVDEETA